MTNSNYPDWRDALGVRLWNILHNHDITTKEEAKTAVIEGRIKIGRTRLYGKLSQAKLLGALGMPVPKDKQYTGVRKGVLHTQCPYCQKNYQIALLQKPPVLMSISKIP